MPSPSRWSFLPLFLCTFVLLALPSVPAPAGRSHEHHLYVSPSGSADAPGTLEQPTTLARVLSEEGPARAGDTIWLRGGVYAGVFVSELQGLPDAPIVVRQYPGERAVIDSSPSPDAALTVLGSWTWFSDFEITNSDPRRLTTEEGSWPSDLLRGAGVFAKGPHNAFVNLVVHDMANGLGVWAESEGSLIYGNVVYYNGWEGPDRSHGHGIYTQNQVGVREISDNIVFSQFSHGIHAYGSSAAFVDDVQIRGNFVFGNGSIARSGGEREILLGGGRSAKNPVLEENVTFGSQNNLGYVAGCSEGRVARNYFVGITPLLLVNCAPSIEDNTFVGPTGDMQRAHPDNVYRTAPPTAGVEIVFRPNRYDPDRAHLAVLNWGRQPSVPVDADAFLHDGDEYEVVDAQNYFGGAVAKGVHRTGVPLVVPLTDLRPAEPVGDVSRPPRHTAPELGVFILRATRR